MWKLKGSFDSYSFQTVLECCDSEHTLNQGGRMIRCGFSGRLLCHSGIQRIVEQGQEAELLAAAYLDSPRFGFLNEWVGNFCFVIHDSLNNSVLIGTDVYGTFPLFYRHDGIEFSFSSEYEELLSKNHDSFNVDAITEFLAFGTVLGTKTFIDQVASIRSGRVVVLSEHVLEEIRIPGSSLKVTTTISELASEVARAFSASVKNHVDLYKECLKVDLSGGLDTRLIASCINQEKLPIQGFQTCYTPPLDEHTDQDVILAKTIAARIGHSITVDQMPLSEKMDTCDFLMSFRAFKPSATLKGIMGGELLNADSLIFIPDHLLSLLKLVENGTDSSEIRHSPALQELYTHSIELQRDVGRTFGRKPKLPVESLLDEFSNYPTGANPIMWFTLQYFVRSFICDIYCDSSFIWLTPHKFLTKTCTPFLDKRILDLLLCCKPDEVRGSQGHRLYADIYERWFPELTQIPTNSLIGVIKSSVFNSCNQGVDRKSLRPKSITYHRFESRELKRLHDLMPDKRNTLRHSILDGWIQCYRRVD